MNRSKHFLIKQMLSATLVVALIIAGPMRARAQQRSGMPLSTPETQGVSSRAILDFLEAIPASGNEFHSFILVRHGHIIAEGWWNPYAPQLKHTLYSLSKSFTATAVGFAVTEKRMTVDDKVISFFDKKELPDTVSPYLAELRVRDLLTMSAGLDPEPSAVVRSTGDWVKAFLGTPIVHEPGTTFLYNSTATFMLSAIVQRVTGQQVIDYLRPRLFAPLGITGMDWETSPDGINTGGWGLRLKTDYIAKFAELFLQKGNWMGKQLIPASWIETASTKKIDQDPSAPQSKKDSSDWLQGYCYQMWRCRNDAYRGDGAYGQYAIVLPKQDAVIAITSEAANMQSELNLIWKYLLPAFKDGVLPADPASAGSLRKELEGLALKPEAGGHSPRESGLSGKTFAVDPAGQTEVTGTGAGNTVTVGSVSDAGRLEQVGFAFSGGQCTLTLKTEKGSYTLPFGAGKWVSGSTGMRGPYLVAAKNNRAGLAPYRIDGSYAWIDDNTLEFKLRYTESPHSEVIRCLFNGNKIRVDLSRSFDRNKEIYTGMSN